MTYKVVFRPLGASLDSVFGTLSTDEQGNGQIEEQPGFPHYDGWPHPLRHSSAVEGRKENMLLNDMSAERQRAFLLHSQLERVVFRTVSWKARSMALLVAAVGL